MSRTKRKLRKGYNPQYISEGGDAQVDRNTWRPRKMRPYTTTTTDSKFTASKTCYVNGFIKGVSRQDKLETKNANRSMKKSLRQKLKKELTEIILLNQ